MASFTRAALYTFVRGKIGDESSVRYLDTDLDLFASAGQREIAGQHPEAMCAADDVVVTDPVDIGAAQEPQLDAGWFNALAYFICEQVFLDDAMDVQNLRLAKVYHDLYKESA